MTVNSRNRHVSTAKGRSYLERQFKWLIVSIVLTALSLVTVKAAYGMYGKARDTGETAQLIQQSVKEMERRHDLAKHHAESVGTERGIDREIRERYGVKKPGEGVIILVGDKDKR